jgi:hypothetical protein
MLLIRGGIDEASEHGAQVVCSACEEVIKKDLEIKRIKEGRSAQYKTSLAVSKGVRDSLYAAECFICDIYEATLNEPESVQQMIEAYWEGK